MRHFAFSRKAGTVKRLGKLNHLLAQLELLDNFLRGILEQSESQDFNAL